MAKYIDSGAFQAALVRKQCGPANQRYTEGWNDCLLRVKSMVSKTPAADVAPVVRCKGCKNSCKDGTGRTCEGYWYELSEFAVLVEDDDFCSYGERKPSADG